MSLIKLAKDQGGIGGWAHRHPILAGGIALTGGLTAADTVTRIAANAIKNKKYGKALMEGWKHHAIEGATEGAIYGTVLSAVEPAILHGALRAKTGDE